MKTKLLCVCVTIALFIGCATSDNKSESQSISVSEYFNYSNEDQFTGGIKMIPISTKIGTFNVYTKRVGNNPKIKVLLLHGGPGGTHEEFDSFDGYFPKEGIEYIYYDQLDSYYSDKPNDNSLWTIEHFVEEVEQVRKALNLTSDNFYLLGQSWGGILAMEYALKYQNNLKGLIVSNMMSSVPEYNKYAQEVLGPQLPPEVLKEIKAIEAEKDYHNPRYAELLMNNYYIKHILRMPLNDWPVSVNILFQHLNPDIYTFMQGPSEFGITGNATLKDWDIKQELSSITVPTLIIGAQHDTMDPQHMAWMASEVQNGRFLLCPNGSHLAQYDDQKTYFNGLIKFLKDVNSQQF